MPFKRQIKYSKGIPQRIAISPLLYATYFTYLLKWMTYLVIEFSGSMKTWDLILESEEVLKGNLKEYFGVEFKEIWSLWTTSSWVA